MEEIKPHRFHCSFKEKTHSCCTGTGSQLSPDLSLILLNMPFLSQTDL